MEVFKKEMEKASIFSDYPKLVEENKSLKEEIQKLIEENSSLRETAALVDGKETTMQQLKETFLKVKAEEINTEAREESEKYKSEWEAQTKPKEVLDAANHTLAYIIDTMNRSGVGAQYYMRESLNYRIPEGIRKLIDAEVDRRCDLKFQDQLKIEADRIASAKLEDLKKRDWPNYFHLNIEPKMRELEAKMQSNVFKTLATRFPITCIKCGDNTHLTLSPEGITDILRNGYFKYECIKCHANQNIILIYLIEYFLSG